jgi:hypothetical protein
MTDIFVDVKPVHWHSAYAGPPFDSAKEALEKAGFPVVSIKINSILRMQLNLNFRFLWPGNRVREAAVYFPDFVALTKNSPIMEDPKGAVQANNEGSEFFPTEEQLERALADCIKLPYGFKSIPLDRLAEYPAGVFLFEEVAKDYADFLRPHTQELPFYFMKQNYFKEKARPFARQILFKGLEARSLIDCGGYQLQYEITRGARPDTSLQQC